MSTRVQRIVLRSDPPYGRRLPPHEIGLLLANLPAAVLGAVSMAMRNRSTPQGKRPDWLKRAADVRYVGHEGNGETALCFEAPALGESARELYEQRELWTTRPDAADTGFDLLGDVLVDVAAANADSERFDNPLLHRLMKFKRVFERTFDEARVVSRRYDDAGAAALSLPVIESATKLYHHTPPPRRVRLVGRLDMVWSSRQTFLLDLDDGQQVRGTLVHGDAVNLAPFLEKRILAHGSAVFRPSGRLLRIDAGGFRAATEADGFFTAMPRPFARGRHRASPADREKMARGLRAVMGKWPGDESDEAVQAALKELG